MIWDYCINKIILYANDFKEYFFSFFILMILFYFLVVRLGLAAHLIPEIKMTKKQQKERNRIVWNRTKKEQFTAFLKWIICTSYTEEQKNRLFYLFVCINYCYLFYLLIGIILWFLAVFHIPFVTTLGGVLIFVCLEITTPIVGFITIISYVRNRLRV